jgi:hypothetical protein
MSEAPTLTTAATAERPAVSFLLGVWALRAAAVWLALGALFKLFLGGPQDLPPLVQDLFGGKETLLLKYRLAIAVELAVAFLAILRPRIGWWLVVGALVVFEVILVPLIAAGETSCGCFGSDFPMSPVVMALIDGVLLVAILLGRPWARTARPIGHTVLALLAVLVAACAPFTVDRRAKAPQTVAGNGGGNATGQGAGGAVEPGANGGSSAAANGSGGTEDTNGAWPFHILSPEEWIGQLVYDIEQLAGWIDFAPLPIDGTYIFYRQTCTHCAAHLEQLAAEDDGTSPFVLIRIVERDDTEENREVVVVPTGPHVTSIELPREVEYALTTPADFVLEGGVVVSGREGIEIEDE